MNIKDEVMLDLQQYPDKIYSKLKDISVKKLIYAEHQAIMRSFENKFLIDKDTLAEILNSDHDYRAHSSESDKLKQEIDADIMMLEFFNDKFKAARALALLIGGEKQ